MLGWREAADVHFSLDSANDVRCHPEQLDPHPSAPVTLVVRVLSMRSESVNKFASVMDTAGNEEYYARPKDFPDPLRPSW